MPLDCREVDFLPVVSRLLPGVVMPVLHLPDGQSGRSFYFEQRWWLEAAGIKDAVAYRKQERKRNVLEQAVAEFHLDACDLSRPDGGATCISTISVSTRLLLGWLLLKRAQTGGQRHAAACLRWTRCLQGVRDVLRGPAMGIEDGRLASFELLDIRLHVTRDGLVDLAPVAGQWPTLAEEWNALMETSVVELLPPFPRSGTVELFTLLVFLDSRIRMSAQIPPQHWLHDARAAVLEVASFLVDADLHCCIEEAAGNATKLVPSQIWGPTGQRRVHRATLPRLHLVQRLLSMNGSSEAITRALTGGLHGVAVQQRGVRNSIYTELARGSMAGSCLISLSWDGSSHGGHDMQITLAENVETGTMVYAKPTVRTQMRGFSKKTYFLLRVTPGECTENVFPGNFNTFS